MTARVEPIAIAAIVHAGKGLADGPLLAFVRQAQSQGHLLRGLLPGPQDHINGCAIRTVLDLEDGTLYPISQNLGKESTACSLDPGALLVAGAVLRRAAKSAADLVIVNRFGVLEAEGGGFATEMLELMARGYPVLTVVSEPNLEAWRKFTGGLALELSPDLAAIQAWFEQVRSAGLSA